MIRQRTLIDLSFLFCRYIFEAAWFGAFIECNIINHLALLAVKERESCIFKRVQVLNFRLLPLGLSYFPQKV